MKSDTIQISLAIVWGLAFLAMLLWFLWKQRNLISSRFVIRHGAFVSFLYAGCLSFLYGGSLTYLIFGKEIHKGDPEELGAVIIFVAGPILCFAIGAVALGKDRVREFKRYVEIFNLQRFTKNK